MYMVSNVYIPLIQIFMRVFIQYIFIVNMDGLLLVFPHPTENFMLTGKFCTCLKIVKINQLVHTR